MMMRDLLFFWVINDALTKVWLWFLDLLAAMPTLVLMLMMLSFCGNHKGVKHSHKKEASTDVVGNRTHPDVAMFLEIFRCDHCLKESRTLHQKYQIRNGGFILIVLSSYPQLFFISISIIIIIGCNSTVAFVIIQHKPKIHYTLRALTQLLARLLYFSCLFS